MRYATLSITFFFAAAVSAAPIVFPPPKKNVCLHDGCIPRCDNIPGMVDVCARNVKFGFDDNRGTPTRVEVQDPKACGLSILDNIKSLSTHYGRHPEISLPTSEMAKRVMALAVPTAAPQAPLRPSTGIKDDTPSAPLNSRILHAKERITALTGAAQEFIEMARETESWARSLTAARQLAERAAEAEKVLSLGRAWPTIEEFGPHVWATHVCVRLKKDMVATLRNRLAQRNDMAWPFAFYDDWIAMLKPFKVAPVVTPTPKDAAFFAIARPFYVEPLDTVRQRSDKTLFTLQDIRAFKRAVVSKATELEPYARNWDQLIRERHRYLHASFEQEKAVAAGLRAELEQERAAMTALRESVKAAVGLQTKTAEDIVELSAALSEGSTRLSLRTEERDKLRIKEQAARADVAGRGDEVDRTQQAVDAIKLDCGGLDYVSCKDESAKRQYDRQKYAANEAYAAARQALRKASHDLRILSEELMATDSGLRADRAQLARQKTNMASLITARDQQEARTAGLRAQLHRAEQDIAPVVAGMGALDEATKALAALLPGMDSSNGSK